MQFVQRRRLDVARRLLLETEDEVTSVCLAVGFESLGSFSALFKRRFGVSPRRFRYIDRTIVSSRRGPVEMIVIGQPVSSSMKRT